MSPRPPRAHFLEPSPVAVVCRLSRAEEFRKNAEECRQQADRSRSQLDKEHWLKIAEQWLKIAQEEEADRDRGTV